MSMRSTMCLGPGSRRKSEGGIELGIVIIALLWIGNVMLVNDMVSDGRKLHSLRFGWKVETVYTQPYGSGIFSSFYSAKVLIPTDACINFWKLDPADQFLESMTFELMFQRSSPSKNWK